jgi:hypothetical protein
MPQVGAANSLRTGGFGDYAPYSEWPPVADAVIEARLDARVARFPSAEAMVRIMMAGTPLATAMTEADPAVLQTVIAEVTEGLATYEDDQGLALPMQAWVVTAKA